MKHLILLFDGTQNSAATGHYEDITNIFRLNLAISRHDKARNPQIVFYMPGPGTRGLIDEQFGGATGQGIDEIIREAYVNLSSNYNSGDLIYIFGFSRGAVAARALTCLIAESGLLTPQRLYKLPTAWKRFVNINQGTELHPGLKDLSADVHPNVRISFLGLFDSVLGRDYQQKSHVSDLVFSNQKISPIVDHGLQVLAIDDTRKVFFPMIWDALSPENTYVEQVWLPGVHADIGGIGQPHFLGLVSLLAMISKIEEKTTIRINKQFMDEMLSRLNVADTIIINDEIYNALMMLLPRSHRMVPPDGVNQSLHYVLDILKDRKFSIKGRNAVYNGSHIEDFMRLPVFHDRFESVVRNAAEIALGRIH